MTISDQSQTTDTDHTSGTKKRAMIATFAIFGSRILGLVREQVFAFFFGAGAVLDAFYVAFRIPNVLRDLAAEGALSQSFVTIFAQKLTTDTKEEAKRLSNKTQTFIMLVMGVVVILGIIFAPQIVSGIGYGFTGDKFDLTVRLLRILFPYIFFISLASLLMGVLNAHKKFFIPFSASTFCNFTAITAGLLLAWLLDPGYIGNTFNKILSGTKLEPTDILVAANAITGMALGTLLGGFGQYLFQTPSIWKLGFRPHLDFGFKDKAFIQMLKLTGPAMIAGASVQLNVLTNTIFASLLEDGSVAWLQLAFRFTQFPLGVFGVAIAAASAPVLAQMISQKRHQNFRESIQASIQLSLFLTLPSMIGLAVLARPIISLVYEYGHVNAYQATQTSYALMMFTLGIASYSLIKIYQPAYLAFHDSKTPMKISLLSIAVNIIINGTFIFVLKWGHWSLALGTSIVACFDIILQTLLFRKKLKNIWSKSVWFNIFKTILAALIMGVAVFYLADWLQTIFDNSRLTGRLAIVMTSIVAAIPIYMAIALALKVKDAHFMLSKILNKLKTS